MRPKTRALAGLLLLLLPGCLAGTASEPNRPRHVITGSTIPFHDDGDKVVNVTLAAQDDDCNGDWEVEVAIDTRARDANGTPVTFRGQMTATIDRKGADGNFSEVHTQDVYVGLFRGGDEDPHLRLCVLRAYLAGAGTYRATMDIVFSRTGVERNASLEFDYKPWS